MLQRIKTLATSSLPTFVDLGGRLLRTPSGSADCIRLTKQYVSLELISSQTLRRPLLQVAFMGDDTWLTVFPTTFHLEMAHDF